MRVNEKKTRIKEDVIQIEDLKKGGAEVWKVFLSRNGPSLLGYATRMLKDKASAEDAVQEALINVYRTIDKFDGRCSLKSWLYRAVRNKAIDEIRRQKRFVDVGEEPEQDFFNAAGDWRNDCTQWDGHAAKELDNKNLLRLVHKEINNLPHAHREVLLLREIEGLDRQEICDALEISSGNLRIRIHRARTALKAVIGDKMNKEL